MVFMRRHVHSKHDELVKLHVMSVIKFAIKQGTALIINSSGELKTAAMCCEVNA